MQMRNGWAWLAALVVLAVPCPMAEDANFVTGTPAGSAYRPLTTYGFDWHVGINGVGFDLASGLSPRLSLRTGVDFFGYSHQFSDSGVPIDANVRLQTAHLDLDWYPRGGRF